MNPQELVSLALKVAILLTVFGFGLEATRDDLLYVVRRPRVLARSLIAMFVIMPSFAVLLTTVFHFRLAVAIALIALAISPVPPLLPRKVDKAGGASSYGLGLMVAAASSSILFIPLAAELIGRYFGRPLAMHPAAVAKLIAWSVLVPLAAGILFQRFAPSVAARIAKPTWLVAKTLLIASVIAILIVAFPKSLSLIGNGTLPALTAFIVVGLVVGHFLGGPGSDERLTLALSTACRHPGLALALAAANIPEERNVSSAILLYLLLSLIITASYIFWLRRKAARQKIVQDSSHAAV
jgi:BASS family bile acid:Na+ symporter